MNRLQDDHTQKQAGKTANETLENVLNLSETNKWHTYTHLPVYTYLNNNYKTTL